MCAMSMMMQHKIDRWSSIRHLQPRPRPGVPYHSTPSRIRGEEIAEFRELLDRARKYDRAHDQPDCGTDDKKAQLLALARDLGADVSAVEEALEGESH